MSARDTARAIDALRRGWPIVLDLASGPLSLLPIETAVKSTDPAVAVPPPANRMRRVTF